MTDVLDEPRKILSVTGIATSDGLWTYFAEVDMKLRGHAIVSIEPVQISGNGGYATWLRVLLEDGSDDLVNPQAMAHITRGPTHA
jgi:hypothetical protein